MDEFFVNENLRNKIIWNYREDPKLWKNVCKKTRWIKYQLKYKMRSLKLVEVEGGR